MKKLGLFLALVMSSIVGFSQITLIKELEGDLGPIGGSWIVSCEDLSVYVYTDNKITIYDENFNSIKVFNAPSDVIRVVRLDKNTFTSSGKYEYIATKMVGNTDNYYLYDEDGNMLYDFKEYSPGFPFKNTLITTKSFYENDVLKYTNRIYRLSGTSSVSEDEGQRPIAVQPYPNPATSMINIPYFVDNTSVLEVYDANGGLVDRAILDPQNTNHQLTTSNYKQGVYIWRIGNDTGKFIIK